MEHTGAGKRLYDLRVKMGKTMDDVVIEINSKYDTKLARANISRWEACKNEPSLAMAKILCEYYGITADYLLGLEEKENDN